MIPCDLCKRQTAPDATKTRRGSTAGQGQNTELEGRDRVSEHSSVDLFPANTPIFAFYSSLCSLSSACSTVSFHSLLLEALLDEADQQAPHPSQYTNEELDISRELDRRSASSRPIPQQSRPSSRTSNPMNVHTSPEIMSIPASRRSPSPFAVSVNGNGNGHGSFSGSASGSVVNGTNGHGHGHGQARPPTMPEEIHIPVHTLFLQIRHFTKL